MRQGNGGVKVLTIDEMISQLESLRDNSADFARSDDDPIWQRDIEACEGAAAILEALQEQHLETVENAVRRIRSYPVLSAACRELRMQFKTGGTPVKIHGTRCCPKCHSPVGMKYKHCPWCGKRLIGRWENL